MLMFVGLGVDQSLSTKSIDALKSCERIFFEDYTSPPIRQGIESEIATDLGGKKIEKVERQFLETGDEVIHLAERQRVAIISPGDPMMATTLQELRTRAMKRKIGTKVIHGSSVLCAISGETGLHSYNFGRHVTVTSGGVQLTAYETVYENLLRGLHTTLLLEWDSSNQFFLPPRTAVKSLLECEDHIKYGILSEDTLLVAVSRIGSEDVSTHVLNLGKAIEFDFGDPPHVMVIPGRLHFTERDFLGTISGRQPESFPDNSERVKRHAKRMIERYSEKTLDALKRARVTADVLKSEVTFGRIKFEEIFENVECYAHDSVRFLNEGKEELAILSIGYAEGLLDSLRFGGLLEFDW